MLRLKTGKGRYSKNNNLKCFPMASYFMQRNCGRDYILFAIGCPLPLANPRSATGYN